MLYKVIIQNYIGYIARYCKTTFLMQAYSDKFELSRNDLSSFTL